jgi:hypothetical protein
VATVSTLVLLAASLATVRLVRLEWGRVPRYVTVGRAGLLLLGMALLPGDPGLAAVLLLAAPLARLRERSYADRFRTRAEALAQFDELDHAAR